MKLRSFSLFGLIIIGSALAGGYKYIEKRIRKKISADVERVIEQKTKAFEKEMVDKYDILKWEEGEIELVTVEDDDKPMSFKELSEEEKDAIDSEEVRDINKYNNKKIESEPDPEEQGPCCTQNTKSTQNIKLKVPYNPDPKKDMNIVYFI